MEGLALELGIEAVKFMAESFMQQLNEQKRLIGDAVEKAEDLEEDLKFLKDYLKDVANKPKSNNVITRALIREVRDSTYRAEDAIDSFAVEAAASDSKCLSGGISKSKLLQIAELVKSVCEKVKKIREKVEDLERQNTITAETPELGENKGPPVKKKKYAPIFNQEEKKLRERLSEEAEEGNYEAIFITGTLGIGKSTLAAKMFHDPDIQKQFSKHIWIDVSNPTAKNIFLAVLGQLKNKIPPGEDESSICSKNNWELSQLVASCLEGETFLIVLDKVSEIEDWGTVESGFERSCKKSKVLITTNNEETARFIGRNNPPIKLSPLNPEDSWALLRWRIGGLANLELENYGKLIAANCKGLPQKILLAGDTLAKKDSKLYEMSRRQKIWEDLSLGMITCFDDDPMGSQSQNTNVLSSYNKLPYQLRACFLYLGIFPQGFFSVSKLIRMWIAEGFIKPRNDVALEKVAEEYLTYLIDRNFVIVEERRPDGSAKTCSMNELLYDFCKTEAGIERENFLQEFRKSSADGAFDPPINDVEKNRRVCIHHHISKFIPKFISSRHHSLKIRLRSFVSHSEEEVFTLPSRDISNIRKAFELLRVLDAKPIGFKKIPSDLCQLVHLRFITLSLNGAVLPASISKLRNIQTLVVHTASRTLEIKADILKMIELRHLKTNASATLPKISKASEGSQQLQTLCEISPKSCTQELLGKTPNLKKLGIRGQLEQLLLDGKNELLGKLDQVEKLKLLNDHIVTSPTVESKLAGLLQPSRFPPSLRSLTLSATCLNWDHISILGSLQKLEELKLKDNAFLGEKWVVSGAGFPHLQILLIERLQYFKHWKSGKDHFPQLRRLKLFECKELMEVPTELVHVRKFQELHFRGGNNSAGECVQTIRDEKLRMKRTDSSIVFKLHMNKK